MKSQYFIIKEGRERGLFSYIRLVNLVYYMY